MLVRDITASEDAEKTVGYRLKAYTELFKLRLSWLVVFSAVVSYFTACFSLDITPVLSEVLVLTIGGFLVTGSSNAFNQILERKSDKLMQRTETRPMPQSRISVQEALIFSSLTALIGLVLLWVFLNPLAGALGLGALLTYVVVYTPMKRISSFAVFVGAFPGAIPPLLGWVAVTGKVDLFGLLLFAIQFMWQFPHFWALAWMLDEDYKRAGFKMLPSADGRSKTSALQIMIYSAGIIPIGLLPYYFEMTGWVSAIIVSACGLYLMFRAVKLHSSLSVPDSKKVMYASLIYLPVVQLALMLDTL